MANDEISYTPDFITSEQEKEVLDFISTLHHPQGREKYGRNLYRFGQYFAPYNTCWMSKEIPNVFFNLGIKQEEFDSITINEFEKDESIGFHHDPPDAGEKIVVLSLAGISELTFRNRENKIKSFTIAPRSLFILEGEMRWKWQHSTRALENRISVVFRKAKEQKNG